MEALQNDCDLAYIWMEAFLQLMSGQETAIVQNFAQTVGCTLTAPIHDLQQSSSSHLAGEGLLLDDYSLTLVYKLSSTWCSEHVRMLMCMHAKYGATFIERIYMKTKP